MKPRPMPDARLDWALAIASFWLGSGMLVDAWYHFHYTAESFIEPAHALLYAGLLVAYAVTAIAVVAGMRRGFSLWYALPDGYQTTLAGLIVFAVGGVADAIKHTLWGFEEGFNALVSPTHLVIGAGMAMIAAGPIRAALQRSSKPATLLAQLPMLVALSSIAQLLHWGTQFVFLSQAERMNAPLPVWSVPGETLTLITLQYDKQGIGLLSVIVQSIFVAAFALYVARRIRLAPGALVVLTVLDNACIALAHANVTAQWVGVVVASFLAGAIGDASRLDPSDQRSRRWLVAAVAMPAAYWAALLAVLAAGAGGLWWSWDVIAGSVVYAAVTGVGLWVFAGPFEGSPPPQSGA